MITMDAANHNGTATYSPNFPGARTWREARSFHINGENVTGAVYNHQGAQWITVHVGCKIAFQGPVPADVTRDNVHTWIVDTATEWAAQQDAEQTAKFEKVFDAERQAQRSIATLPFAVVPNYAGVQADKRKFGELFDALTWTEKMAYGKYRSAMLAEIFAANN